MNTNIVSKLKRFAIGAAVLGMAVIQPIDVMPTASPFNTVVTAEAAVAKKKPGKVTLRKISSPAYNQIKITWKKASNATNYVIFYKKQGARKWTKLKVVSSKTTSYTHKSSKKYPIVVGQKYTYTVRAYNNKAKKYGSYNTRGLTARTLPGTVKLKKASLNSTKTVATITWNKASGASHYAIFRKTGSSGWKKLGTLSSKYLKYNDRRPVTGTKNTYTVRAYYSKTRTYGKYNTRGVSVTLPKVKVKKLALNRTSVSLTKKGQTYQLKATASPSNATTKSVTWKSSNTKVVTVNSAGKLTAVGNGSATITATAKDGSKKKVTCKVTVKIPRVVKVSKLTLNRTSVSLTKKGQTYQLTATASPSNATNKSVIWQSSNTRIVTVNSSGKLTAVGNGSATITATAKDGSKKTATCKVTVKIPTVVKVNSVSLNYTDVRLSSKGQTLQLTATVSPSNAANKSVKWTSSNTKVATVSSSGKVTAVANGNTTITATADDGSGKKDICAVTVNIPKPADPTPTPTPSVVKVSSVSLNQSSLSLTKKGQTAQLSASVSPSNATNKSVTWSSSNSNVATINNGVVTAVGNGSATITATAADGSGKRASCSVTVNIPTAPGMEKVNIAGGESKICSIYFDEIPTGVNLANIKFTFEGNDSIYENLGYSYTANWNTYVQVKGLKTGTFRVKAVNGSQVLRTWEINVTSNWQLYMEYTSWKKGVEAQIWNNNMSLTEKLKALHHYINTEFTYSLTEDSEKYYSYKTKKISCVGASDLFGDMAKDLGVEVRYVDYHTGTLYEYLVDAVSNSTGHTCNAVYLNGQWVMYDAQPPVN